MTALSDESRIDPPKVDSPDAVKTYSDRKGWDELVAGNGGQPFQSWAWGELKSHFGWEPHRLAAGNAAAQVLIRPYRGLAVTYVPRGPVFSGTAAADHALVNAIVRLARSRRAAFVRFEPDVLEGDAAADSLPASLRHAGFRPSDRTLQPRSSIRLDLTPTEDQLMAAFSKGHRADIRRAERDRVEIRVGAPEADADVLHQMLVATNQRKSFGFHSASYYRRLLHAFGDAARLQVAEIDGVPIGASLILRLEAPGHIPCGRVERGWSRASRRTSAAVARDPLGQGARRRDVGPMGHRRRARPLRARVCLRNHD